MYIISTFFFTVKSLSLWLIYHIKLGLVTPMSFIYIYGRVRTYHSKLLPLLSRKGSVLCVSIHRRWRNLSVFTSVLLSQLFVIFLIWQASWKRCVVRSISWNSFSNNFIKCGHQFHTINTQHYSSYIKYPIWI